MGPLSLGQTLNDTNFFSGQYKHLGAAEAYPAHNREDGGSKPPDAIGLLAQWQSARLLTGRSLVRTQLEEKTDPLNGSGKKKYLIVIGALNPGCSPAVILSKRVL